MMDLHRHLRSLALLIFILATYFSTALARHHRIRHNHHRHKRQHTSSYLPGNFVFDGDGAPDSGSWGPWSEATPCSRPCGGGVASQTRECASFRSDGAEACTGGHTRYFSCNIQDCPGGEVDFRAEQCAEYNSVPFEGRNYDWVPYTKAPNRCELNCMPRGERFYYRHKRKVVDGTRCEEEKLDICVDGRCLPVGCDNLLGSSAREDKCRECGGDSSSCKTEQGLISEDNLQVGYNDILIIPAGATNIYIHEIEKSNNYLAIRNESGHYYLNGNWRIDFPRSLKFAGTTFHYERKPHGFFAPEKLVALGPTTETLFIVLLYQATNPGVRFEYSIPEGVVAETDPDGYSWIPEEFSECSATCGGGVQRRRIICARRRDGEQADTHLCDPTTAPPSQQACAAEACPARWAQSEWTPCSASCGEGGGVQSRQVYCEIVGATGLPSIADDAECARLGEKPENKQACNEGMQCPQWHIGPWKPCDHLCGDGQQRRKVQCFVRVDGKINVLGDSACPEKPEDTKPCMIRPCEGVDWVTSEWSGCEDKCSLTQETRKAFCANQAGKVYPDAKCQQKRLPTLVRDCETPVPCEFQWYAAQWSKCSAQCGVGVKTRKVFCATTDEEDNIKKVEDEKCDPEEKYELTENCTAKAECTGQWFSGPWSSCSKECGGGVMTRKVICLLDNVTVEAKNCDPSLTVFSSDPCNNHQCSADQIMPMEPEKVTVSEEEECEEEEDGFITMDTTLALDDISATPGSATTMDEGSGDESSSPGMTEDMLISTTVDESSSIQPSSLEPSSLITDDASSSDVTDDSSASTLDSSSSDAVSTDLSTSDSSQSSDVMLSDSTYESDASSALTTSLDDLKTDSSGTETATNTETGSEDTSEMTTLVPTSTAEDSTESSSESSTDVSTSDTDDSTGTDGTTGTDGSTESDGTTPTDSSTPTESSTSTDDTTTDMVSETTTDSASEMTTDAAIQTTTEEDYKDGPLEVEEAEKTKPTAGTGDSEATTDSAETAATTTASSGETSDQTTTGSSEESSDATTTAASESDSSDSSTTDGSTMDSSATDATTIAATPSTGGSEGTSETGGSESTVDVSTASEGTADTLTSTISSDGTVTAETDDGATDSSQSSIEMAVTKEQRVKKCKPKKSKKKCETSEFGCCSDGTTQAEGPFSKGCPAPMTCAETKHGCCSDGVSPAEGPKEKGCPPSLCAETLFGCCQDGISAAEGNDFEGCPTEEIPFDCASTEFGCCPDMILSATGPNHAGCYTCEGSGECDTCNDTRFGCCPDNVKAATGPDQAGCEDEEGSGMEGACSESEHGCCPDGKTAAKGANFKDCGVIDHKNCTLSYFGCCPNGETPAMGPSFEECQMPCETEKFGCCDDGRTPAHGENLEGCCLNSAYGCCPDNILSAQGPNLEGCGCQYSRFGCCPDNSTAARGASNEGCGCQHTPHGCCPNRYTPAAGPDYQGCPCHTYQFGCCQDGETIAKGPQNQGCGCENTEFGCCSDQRTRALGPDGAGCECDASRFGCCPDGITDAQGDKFEGCDNIPLVPGEACSEAKDRGSCREFTVKWFFDMEYGGCSRFWYGGCEGNNNRFKSQEECKGTCVEPAGRDACYLPKVEGPCEGYYPMWYYDSQRKQCGQFIYGGCLGNNNKFQTLEECQGLCVTPETADACDQPKHEGPCQGNFTKWHFDAETKVCQEFTYGGCKGNRNNFGTESSCVQKCLQPGRSRVFDICKLPSDTGPCRGSIKRWYYDAERQTCRRFMYRGCKGNENRFRTRDQCENRCHIVSKKMRDLCALPREVGTCDERLPKWFFDASENRCMPFYYTGCDGNGNRFDTQEACMADCPPKVEQDVCLLPAIAGECHNYTERWYYDSYEVRCRQFYFGGCGGNPNNFRSQDDCQRRCESGFTTVAPAQTFSSDSCFLPDDAGPCQESRAQWFYDSRDGVCKQFLYGGCDGNANRFGSRQDCEQRCGNVQDLCGLPVVVGPCSGTYQQFYYDRAADSCFQFDYGGCQGNANKFNDLRTCEERCKKGASSVTSAPQPVPSERENEVIPADICRERVDPGPCSGSTSAWYYDERRRACTAFIYGGCEGNANRFESEEQCERQCGRFTGVDVCNEQPDAGDCRARFQKFYFDRSRRTCEEFVYGGCNGNGNRFSTVGECESVCLHLQEPIPQGNNTAVSHQAVCRQPVDPGSCQGESYKRWYYDEYQQTCNPFIYTGCAGNFNRFKDFKTCLAFCTNTPEEVDEREERPEVEQPRPTPPRPTRPINEIDVDAPHVKVETACNAALDECNRLRCPYGIERFVDQGGCERCRCHDVCEGHTCEEGMQCAIDLYQNPDTGNTEFRAVCRQDYKAGECPTFTPGTSNCVRECNSDADCDGQGKCCPHDCGTSCVASDRRPRPVQPPPQPPPVVDPAGPYRPGSPPRVEVPEPDVEAEEGNYATLRCIARGNPTPTVTWRNENGLINGTGGRHKLLLDGSLQIIGLYRTDAGRYVCTADNGVGQPAQREVQLRITDPVSRPAEIIGEPNTYVVVTMGTPATLQCYAIGFPRPSVTWWRGDRMLPMSSTLFEQRRDYSLYIRTITLRQLGPYTCQAYNGLGKAASWSITVQSVGPVYSTNVEDEAYMQYLVQQRRPVNGTDSQPEQPRPSYPYRPARPPPPPPPAERPTPPAPAPSQPTDRDESTAQETPRIYIVPVSANITADRNSFAVGSDVSILCNVEGHPKPRVLWFKDEQRIESSENIQISESNRLLIVRANASDSGTYRCEAANQFGSSTSSINISVQGLYIHPNCTDNPFFANCQLIVQAQYCTHKYYARFCCRSCTQAGQLPSTGPHLDRSGTISRSSRRK